MICYKMHCMTLWIKYGCAMAVKISNYFVILVCQIHIFLFSVGSLAYRGAQ